LGSFLFLKGGVNLLTITDIFGNEEALSGYKGLKCYRNVSGEKTLAFLILPTPQNAHSFNMVQEESILEFKNDTYRIKQVTEKNRGQTFYKEVVAIHTLFDLIDDYKYEIHTGSMTFQAALQFVLTGTAYTWDIVDTFYAQDFENFGNDNRLSLFQELLKRYEAEFTLNGTHLMFKTKIGNNTDFQFRYNYNVKTITRNVNTNNLSTYGKGFGKRNEDGTVLVQTEYTSPNASYFGIRHAKPIDDERYTTVDGLLAAIKANMIDAPEVSITIDFVDMRRAGYPYDVPNEGDYLYIIYEPMNNLDLEARLIDIEEEYEEFNEYPIRTAVTLSNFRNSVMYDQLLDFSRTQKQINGLFDGSRKLPYNALDEAVKRATAALQAAQTELVFENGIIARDKTNPNFLVLFNSNGIGISRDGGQTYKEAITSEGFVLSAGAIGQLSANNIQIGPDTSFEDGYDPTNKVDYEQFTEEIATIHNQLDGKVEAWFYDYDPTLSNPPASSWTTAADKAAHVGDTFTNTENGYSWRFLDKDSGYQWVRIADTDALLALEAAARAQDTADGKRRVFVSQPVPPYDIGDLWTGGPTGDIMRCKISRASGAYSAGDWDKASKYTDDTRAVQAETNAKAYADTLKTALTADIADADKAITDLDTYLEGAFKDGIITKAESIGIAQRINTLNAEKSDLDSRYTQVYGSTDLSGTPKTDLASKKNAYNTAHTNLINAINTAIADGKITATEKNDVDSKEAAYHTALGNLSTSFENAVNAIAAKKATNAQSAAQIYADGLKATIEGEIQDVIGDVNALNTYVDGSFKDGVISAAEATAIEKYINQINAEKADLDSRYTSLYAAAELTGSTEKTGLAAAKTAYNTAHTNLISSINSAIADGKTISAEKTDVDTKFAAYKTKLGELSTAFEKAIEKIRSKKATAAENAAKAYADTLKAALAVDIQDVVDDLTALDTYVDGSFKDGVISQAEAKSIEKYINQINAEKEDIDNRYTAVYNTSELSGTTEKTNLSSAKTAYNTAHTNLISAINSAISDGKTTATEKANVDSKFSTYRTELGDLSTAFEKAITKIASVKIDNVIVSGRNLIKNSDFKDNSMSGWSSWGTGTDLSVYSSTYYDKGIHVQKSPTSTSPYGVQTPTFYMEANQVYTVSFLFQSRYNSGYDQDYIYLRSGTTSQTTIKKLPNYNLNDYPNVFGSTAIWKVAFQFSHTETVPAARLLLGRTDNGGLVSQGFIIGEIKVEKGNKATEYSLSVEDTLEYMVKEATKVRDDLRLTAPLPTSITMNQSGIRASSSDPTKYVQIDYRGIFTKKGMFAVERPDGYMSIQDGIMRNSFTIQGSTPTFKAAGVVEVGQFYRTNAQSATENIQRYVFKHDSRYIRIIANMYCDGGVQYGNVGRMSFSVFDDNETVLITDAIVSETRHSTGQGYRKDILLDVGVPTGAILVLYWRMYSSTTYHTYGSVRYLVQEG
jgi:hypothetical protein